MSNVGAFPGHNLPATYDVAMWDTELQHMVAFSEVPEPELGAGVPRDYAGSGPTVRLRLRLSECRPPTRFG